MIALRINKQHPKEDSKGQAMVLAVIALGGTILGATTIAGFLMIYQIRQTTDIANSTKSIFAADAGIECGLYNHFVFPVFPGSVQCTQAQTFATNGAAFTADCSDATDGPIACTDANAANIFSRGSASTARRAFILLFDSANAFFP